MVNENITVMGTGTIGTGWVTYLVLQNQRVNVYDIDYSVAQQVTKKVAHNLSVFEKNDALCGRRIPDLLDLITVCEDAANALSQATIIFEACPDSLEIKRDVLRVIDQYAPASSLIMSSSSGLPATKIAQGSKNTSRVLVAHPLNPPYLIPLVEVCPGQETSQENLSRAIAFLKEINKVPVLCKKEVQGYISNRIQWAVYREIVHMVQNGVCTVEDADKVLACGNGIRLSVLGLCMILALNCGEAGIRDMKKFSAARGEGIRTLSKASSIPDEWYDLAQAGVDEEKRNLGHIIGSTKVEIEDYRDAKLIELLKLKQLL